MSESRNGVGDVTAEPEESLFEVRRMIAVPMFGFFLAAALLLWASTAWPQSQCGTSGGNLTSPVIEMPVSATTSPVGASSANPGTHLCAVFAANAGGESPASNELHFVAIRITMPPTPGVPGEFGSLEVG